MSKVPTAPLEGRDKSQQPPQVPIGTLKMGTTVDSVYLLKSFEQRSKKNGDPYFTLQLADATGSAGAVMWDNHDALLSGILERDDFARVVADVAEYNGATQLSLRKISRVEDDAVELGWFLPQSPRSRAEMEEELDAAIASIKHPDIARLMEKFFRHPRLRDMYCTAPAAARLHQAYIGGLLEHTLIVLKHAVTSAPQYHPVDLDVLTAGALLHDIGKIREYSWSRTIGYTDEGRLIGHVVLGAMMADTAMRELQREPEGFNDSIRRHILHLILSHHGKLEWGAPVTPKTREAMLLHYADQLDAFMVMACDAMNDAQGKGDVWTSYNKLFSSYLYAGPPTGGLHPTAPNEPPRLPPPPPVAGHPDDVFSQTSKSEY